jgi:hypothetical protein
MNKPHGHNDIIERKLEQLPTASADSLWSDMHAILDKKMPQKKEARRFIAWFLISKPFLLLTAGFIIGTASSRFFLFPKKNSSATIATSPDSSQLGKISENDQVKISKHDIENITSVNKPTIGNNNKMLVANPRESSVDKAPVKSFATQQKRIQPEKYTINETFSETIQDIYKSRPNIDLEAVNFKSANQDLLITARIIDENNLLTLEPVPAYTRKNNGTKNESGFYTGIITGVDLSSIGFRSAKAGSTKGFMIGYSLNNKWSIESGLLWDTKRVSDNGDHFNPPGYTPSSGITIIAVSGKSRLYELPLNVKYTIIPGKHRFFATTGLSSYIMRSENYDYEYLQNNQPGGHNYLSYKNETKNWFSVVNFSMGYSHNLGSLGELRLEPYLKLPIGKIGVGRMPIMSTGLNIGFTKTVR